MLTRILLPFSMMLSIIHGGLYAAVDEAPLLNRSTLGLNYDIAFRPTVSRMAGGEQSSLNQLHRASLEVMYPYFRYFALGVSLDYTLAVSPKFTNPNLNFSKETTRLKSTFLGVSGHVRPQLPFSFGNWDMILYAEAQLGLGTSSPITFGTEALSDYQYDNTKTIPTPFPLMFETTPKIGMQLFGWRFIGVDFACGYRMMWVVHPMVSIPHNRQNETMSTSSRSAVFYDVSSFFLQAGLKFAF